MRRWVAHQGLELHEEQQFVAAARRWPRRLRAATACSNCELVRVLSEAEVGLVVGELEYMDRKQYSGRCLGAEIPEFFFFVGDLMKL